MKGLKDFFYDKNDIFIALLILLIATCIIFWRMDVIMDYPKTLAETPKTTTEENEPSDDGNNPSAVTENPDGDTSLWSGGTLTKDVTVTIASGSATGAVGSLIDAGLFESYDEFVQVCNAAGYSENNIKATTFTFSAGSTQTDIAIQVTQ